MSDSLDYTAMGQRIRKAREAHFLTQEQLGEICSLSAAHIGHIERGTRKPSLETLFKISSSLKVSLDSLVFDSVKSDDSLFCGISAMLKTKSKPKVEAFMNTVRILADKIDDM